MASENNNNGLKVALGILAVLLIGAATMFFLKNNELTETKKVLNEEIDKVTAEYESLDKEYASQIEQNGILNEDLIRERERLSLTLDSLRASQADVKTLLRYKNQFFRLKKEKDRLFAENQKLQEENKYLTMRNDTITNELAVERQLTDSLTTQVTEREKIIESASEISVAGLKGLAIIEKSSGKQVLTDKARRADKVKVCFSVAENKIAEAGDKELYVQVLDANNNVLGENGQVEFNGKILNYSLITSFNYNNKALDICEYIGEPKGGFEKGNYFVNVFKGNELISNSSFTLK